MPRARLFRLLLTLGILSLAFTGCATPSALRFDQGRLEPGQIAVPGRVVSNLLFVEGTVDGAGPYLFLVDTGSSVTLVSDRIATRTREFKAVRNPAPVQVLSAAGGATLLGSTVLPALELGAARFTNLRAAVYDFADFSNHLGVTVDGILGFPVFQEVLLTLDYPRARIVLSPRFPARTVPGTAVPFAVEDGTRPLINVSLGNTSFMALLDSGSDLALTLNPVGLDLKFKSGPRKGPMVASLSGNAPQQVGRLADTLVVGTTEVVEPRVMLTDQLSSIGAEILRHFTVTFDQKRGLAVFSAPAGAPVRLPPQRSTGLSFVRMPSEWRVIQVLDDAPPATHRVEPGDVCVSIQGEPVNRWNQERFDRFVRDEKTVALTLRRGEITFDVKVPVFDLVP